MHVFTFLERSAFLLYSGPNINLLLQILVNLLLQILLNLLFQILVELCHFVYNRGNYVKMEKTAVKDLHIHSHGKYGYNVYRTLTFGTHHVCYGVITLWK